MRLRHNCCFSHEQESRIAIVNLDGHVIYLLGRCGSLLLASALFAYFFPSGGSSSLWTFVVVVVVVAVLCLDPI